MISFDVYASTNSTHIVVYCILYIVCCNLFLFEGEILRHLNRFICTFLTKAACCQNIEIVLHPTTLSYIYIHKTLNETAKDNFKNTLIQ